MAAPLSLKTKLRTPQFDQTRDWYRDLLRLEVLEEWLNALAARAMG